MPVDLSALTAAIAASNAEVTRAEGLADSAIALFKTFASTVSDAVTKALQADNDATATSIAVAQKAITDTTAAFVAKDDEFAAALAANSEPPAIP